LGTGGMNVQDVFLNRLRRSETAAQIQLIDGTQKTGRIVVFDAAVVLLLVNDREILLYKNNIVGVMPVQTGFRVFTEDQRPDWPRNVLYGPEPKGETPEEGFELGEKGSVRIQVLQRPHKPHYPS
jgi:RNA chaperone Hfq